MPIAHLPRETTRALTSTLALNDAVSVVKELIDNALDAKADSISVELSYNTLDIIQVKDNGTGIGIEDRQLLCKRGCTSKIRSIEDLASLGGTFLGFRGEALASVSELSEAVSITTRIDGEVVGTTLQYGGTGQLTSSSSASHPIGTTVRIQKFLTKVPVRKQTAEKTCAKTLVDVRKMLNGYAFARPDVRLSLKVLKSKNAKDNWSYARGAPNASMSEATTKIVGKPLSGICKEHFLRQDLGAREGGAWSIRALILDGSADLNDIQGTEQYISVDRRPLSAERGILKGLTKLYKQYLGHALSDRQTRACPSKPFIYACIECPSDSYDVNIEPAKDELLFYRPDILRSLFETLLIDAYGKLPVEEEHKSLTAGSKHSKSAFGPTFELLMARKDTSEAASEEQILYDDHDSKTPSIVSAEDVSFRQARSADADYASEDEPDAYMMAKNPWTMARSNVILPPKSCNTESPEPSRNGSENRDAFGAFETPEAGMPQQTHRTPLGQKLQLPSPTTTPEGVDSIHQNPGPPSQTMRRRARQSAREDEHITPATPISPATQQTSLLDAWVQQSAASSQRVLAERQMASAECVQRSPTRSIGQSPMRQGRVTIPPNPALRANRQLQSLQSDPLRQPFGSPYKSPRQASSHHAIDNADHAADDEAVPECRQLTSATSDTPYARAPGLPPVSSNGYVAAYQQDLDEILRFEKRKRLAHAQQRKLAAQEARTPQRNISSSHRHAECQPAVTAPVVMNSETPPIDGAAFDDRFGGHRENALDTDRIDPNKMNNPHQNRYRAAIRDLDSRIDLPSTMLPARRDSDDIPKIPESDPRGYLIRHSHLQEKQGRVNGITTNQTKLKIKRTKTTRLPFETIPQGEEIFMLNAVFDTESAKYMETCLLVDMDARDDFTTTGEKASSWQSDEQAITQVRRTMEELVRQKFREHTAGASNAFTIDIGQVPEAKTLVCYEHGRSRNLSNSTICDLEVEEPL